MNTLTKCLRDVVSREYPGYAVPASATFFPMYSLDVGELSTSVAVEIAKATKQRAEQVADRLIMGLSREIAAEWRNDNGYVVCSNAAMSVVLSEVCLDSVGALAVVSGGARESATALKSVWCLLPDSKEPMYARLRVVARAMVQALLGVVYCGPLRVCIEPVGSHEVATPHDVLALFQQAVQWILEHERETRRDVVLPSGYGRVAVWTTHHYHESLSAATRQQLASLRREGRVRLTMPADGWLLSRDRALAEILMPKALHRVVDQLQGADGWGRLLFHLASTVPSGDFDPAVALFDEASSPLWNVRALVERYARLSGTPAQLVSQERLRQLIRDVAPYRKLVLAALFLPLYTARAIVHNEVMEWSGVFERLAREGHAFLNAPATRLFYERKSDAGSCTQIAAGLSFGLSYILPLITEE